MSTVQFSTQTEPTNTHEFQAELSKQNMVARAIRLFEDGYSIFAVIETTNTGKRKAILGAFTVVSPKGEAYALDVLAQSCTCVCNRRNGVCKHKMGAYRLGCRQAHTDMDASWPFRHTPKGMLRYMEAHDLLVALEAAKVAAQRGMAGR